MAGRQGGLPLWLILGMSLLVFAGSSQIMAADMLIAGAGPFSTILTVLVVNLRHVVMAADLALRLKESKTGAKLLDSFFLTDEVYAVCTTRFRDGKGNSAYLLGCGLDIYLFWGLSGLVGYFFGNHIPPVLAPAFGFAMAAAFLAMLIPIVRDWPTLAAVLTSLVVSVGGSLWLPGKWVILLAAFAGSAVGFLCDERRRKGAAA